MSKLNKILDFLIYSNIYISSVATIISYVFFKLMGLSINYIILIPFFIMFIIYNFNKITDVIEDSISNPKKSMFTMKYNKYLLLFSAIAYGIITLLSLIEGLEYGVAILVPFLIGILYSKGVVLKSKNIRLKDILLVKNLTVAITWAFVTVGLPSILLNIPFTQEVYFFGLIVFLRMLIDEIFGDIKDIDGDAQAGVKTIPSVCGVALTGKLLIYLNIAFTSILLFIYLIGNFKPLFLYIVLFTAACGFLNLIFNKKSIIEINKLSDVIVYGNYIAIGILVYFIK